jgi:uncharacterized protein
MEISIRFYEELNEFLPPGRRKRDFTLRAETGAPIVHLIEQLGVPRSEVDLILVNGKSVPFSERLEAGDRISVYPVFEALDISGFTRLPARPLRDPRFILDVHLGRLAKYLRMLGFDALYRNDFTDDEIASLCAETKRILLTRDRELLRIWRIDRGYRIRGTNPVDQVQEVLARFDLARSTAPFSRCLACNGAIRPASPDEVSERVAPEVASRVDAFSACSGCGGIYWKGSHYDRMCRTIRKWIAV